MWFLRIAVPAAAALVLAACAQATARRVRILEPKEGAVLAGPDVRVALEARGIEIAPAAEQRPGTAHHHLFLDTELTPPDEKIPAGVTGIIHLGRGQSEFTFEKVGPGLHRLIAQLADPNHVPLKPLVVDTVRFRVGP